MPAYAASVAKFSALSPNLPRLAAKAALDLDLALAKNQGPQELPLSVSELLGKLRTMENSSLWREAPESTTFLQDPINGDVFRYSLTAARLSSLSDLDASAQKVIDVDDANKRSLFEALRDFFVALSEFASHKRDAIFAGGQGTLPYRMG
jgi:hypothetical protein